MSTYRIEFITPLFSKGAYDDRPEIRAASIRGQLHWWFRALGGNATEEKVIFGGVHGGGIASKVVIRTSALPAPEQRAEIATLPHKQGGQASPKWAIPAGQGFDLHILRRLGGLPSASESSFTRAFEAWLFLGTLGLRATRAAGSFVWTPTGDAEPGYPSDFERYEAKCQQLVKGTSIRFALLSKAYSNSEAARLVVSDTLGGHNDQRGRGDLARLNDPLGKIFGGRKTSPLRFRIVRIGNQHRITALWDGRRNVTGNHPSDLAGIIKLLAERKPALGQQLEHSSLFV